MQHHILLEAETKLKAIFARQPYLKEAMYAIQIAASSMHPGQIRYNLIVSHLADSIEDVKVSVETEDALMDVIKQLDGKLDHQTFQKLYIESRIQGYKNRIAAAEEELATLNGSTEG